MKFGEKTGLDGAAFLRFCDLNPSRDVYFINPFPIEICYGNIWRQGELWTPGITAMTQELEERQAEDPEPVMHSSRHQRFLQRQE